MADFPQFHTSAFAQYPSRRATRFRNQALQFVDGRHQRYRDSAAPLRTWTLELAQLEPSELKLLALFFLDRQGSAETFTFRDPWNGTEYPNCSIRSDEFLWTSDGELSTNTQLEIVENRL